MRLSEADLDHLLEGALFTSCSVSHEWCEELRDTALEYMRAGAPGPELLDISAFEDTDLIATIGFVNKGQPVTELRPVGDEFVTCLELLAEAVGRPVRGIMPLAGGNANVLLAMAISVQTGLPVVDADPMGRIFPLVNQTVFTLAGLPVGPVAAAGALGESAVLQISRPERADHVLRSLADEFGGWVATASYPMDAATAATSALLGSLSQLISIGSLLRSPLPSAQKHAALRRLAGVKQVVRAEVAQAGWHAHPSLPGQVKFPSQVILNDLAQGRVVQLQVENEILMLMIDGSVRASMPDIITLMDPESGAVLSLEHLWPGNVVDVVVLPAAPAWYTPEGLALAGPEAFGLGTHRREGRR
ncbi:DUF917 domain-containing protein [Galactobacter valiniphilus]|uniref:DUF917 domain-containing protein n=1 Tax=Galactobacter valiniphilus TaxID=2676122 RepID=A0A399JF60_9MICC|nr:DUF917 domain-containing protein [Galactobacter valiniphilus]RII42809.1 DUF917 domain-containing protein [Galactobacter valiniphilus]